MSFCGKCGKKLPEGVTVCDCEVQQSSEAFAAGAPIVNGMPNVAPITNATPYVTPVTPTLPVASAVPVTNEAPDTATVMNVLPNEAPVTQAPEVSAESPFVVPMGNNGFCGSMPAGNGAPMSIPAVPVNNNGDSDEEYLNATKDCKIINILGIILFLAGIVSILFINEWVAAIIFFIGEFFVLVPKSRVQKLCKTKNPTADKKTKRAIEKEAVKKIKAKNKHFIIASVIAYVCLVGLIVSFIVPVPLINGVQNLSARSNNYGLDSETKTQEEQGSVNQDDLDSSGSGDYVIDPIVGSYDYYDTADFDTAEKLVTSYPCIDYVTFEADGTGELSLKESPTGGYTYYELTWEYEECIDNRVRKYIINIPGVEPLAAIYISEVDMVSLYLNVSGNAVMNNYLRSGIVQGNRLDGASNVDIIVGTFNYVGNFDSDMNSMNTTPDIPYLYSLTFYNDGSCMATVKVLTSTNPEGFENVNGTWEYEQTVDGVRFYSADWNGGWSWDVMYDSGLDMCLLMDSYGLVAYGRLGGSEQ